MRLRIDPKYHDQPPEVKTRWSHELCMAMSEAGYPVRPDREIPNRPGEWTADPPLETVPDEVWNKAVTLLADRHGLELVEC